MRTKNLLIATLVLGLAALAVLKLGRPEAPSAPAKSPLVDAALLTAAVKVEVRANGKSATIEKGAGDVWTVKEKLGLPADVENRLAPLLRALQKAENLGVLTSNAKRIERLGLGETSVTLTAADGRSWSAEIGRTTDDGSGSAVRLKGAPEALRTTFTGYVEGDPTSWFDPRLHNKAPEEVKSLTLTAADGSVSGARPAKGQPFPGKESGVLESIAQSVGAKYKFDDGIKLTAKSCGVPNAFWDPQAREITYCYELAVEHIVLIDGYFKREQTAKN